MTIATKNATKRSSASEHLVNNRECAKKYDFSRFKILHQCNIVTDLIKMEAISIYLEKPVKNLIIKYLYLAKLSDFISVSSISV